MEDVSKKIKEGQADKKLVLQEEMAFAIAHANVMGLKIDEIREYYAQKELERQQTLFAEMTANALMVTGQLGSIFSGMYSNRILELENWANTNKNAINNSRLSEEEKAAAIKKIDEKTAKEKKKIAREQAQTSKALALMEAVVNTAAAIVKTLPNIPLSIVVGALGLAQVSVISNQPLPALAQGGMAFGPTTALIGDNTNAMSDPEVIAPLSKLQGLMGSGEQTIIINLDGKQIARSTVANMPSILRLAGVTI